MTGWENLVTSVLLAFGIAASAAPSMRTKFESSAHFYVLYPSNWVRRNVPPESLLILSSRGGPEAVIIKHGQASISVTAGPAGESLADTIRRYEAESSVLSRRDVAVRPVPRGCGDMQEIVSREPIVPLADAPISVPYVVTTAFFCRMAHRTIVTLLRNYEGDPRQRAYRQTALQVALSIRYLP